MTKYDPIFIPFSKLNGKKCYKTTPFSDEKHGEELGYYTRSWMRTRGGEGSILVGNTLNRLVFNDSKRSQIMFHSVDIAGEPIEPAISGGTGKFKYVQ
jgi:hypothetical protein